MENVAFLDHSRWLHLSDDGSVTSNRWDVRTGRRVNLERVVEELQRQTSYSFLGVSQRGVVIVDDSLRLDASLLPRLEIGGLEVRRVHTRPEELGGAFLLWVRG
jgi:hypothetical protein